MELYGTEEWDISDLGHTLYILKQFTVGFGLFMHLLTIRKINIKYQRLYALIISVHCRTQ